MLPKIHEDPVTNKLNMTVFAKHPVAVNSQWLFLSEMLKLQVEIASVSGYEFSFQISILKSTV